MKLGIFGKKSETTVGFIGLGIMGSRMAENLAKAEIPLFVYNRTKEKAEELLKYPNVTWKDSPAKVAKEVDVLFTMLSTPQIVEELAYGDDGFLTKLKKTSTWVDCTTVNPQFSMTMADNSLKRAIHFLDAPAAGSAEPAQNGELTFFVGGENAQIKKCEPYFNAMGKQVIHVGKYGKGSALKMVFNLMLGQAMQGFAEGMLLGESLGLSQDFLFDTLLQSPVAAPFLANKRTFLSREENPTEFPLWLMQKDLQLAADTAYAHDLSLPAVNHIKEIYSLARQKGMGDKDFSAIYQFLKPKTDQS
ncbi:MAG: NAD-binding protein [Caldithrix sp.]|nr:NAD-binding protein [Caldithrix sp.]